MSYIQIEIGPFKVEEGKEVPGSNVMGLKFDKGASITFGEYVDPNRIAATSAYALIYAGLTSNLYRKREEVTFTFDECCEWVDKLDTDVLNKVTEVYMASEAYKKLLPAEDEVKKKYIDRKEYRAYCIKTACGKLGWTEYELYTSSPESFHYAVEGYFDKEKNNRMLMRKVAQAATWAKPDEFRKFWKDEYEDEAPVRSFGSKEEIEQLRNNIAKAYDIKLN